MNGDSRNAESYQQSQQIEALKRQLIAKILSREAYERLGRVRLANPTLASQVELYLIQIYQAGNLNTPIGDDKLKEVLKVLTQKRETKIKRS